MTKRKWMRFGATPMLLLGLSAPFWMTACDPAEVCDADLAASLKELNIAVESLVAVSSDIRFDVATACANIATDLGETDVPTITDADTVTDEMLTTACNKASAALDGALSAGVVINIAIEGGHCEINADAQFTCEGECGVDATCDPGTIDVRCKPGELAVKCSADCKVGGSCQGTATVKANCNGSCDGVCQGTCNGTATGADGTVCNSTCKGTCTGECKLDADVDVDCGVDAYCKGGCDADFTAPRCEGEMTPPTCEVDAECQAACEGQAKFEASCTEPKIYVEVVSGTNQALVDTLTANFGKIVEVAVDKGPLVVSASADVATKFADASAAVGGTALCGAVTAANLAANAALATSATATVNVSVKASVNVQGSASG
ncbi:MAG TPA: hypothetical protein ENK23_05130, partial [Sorangium sp.]|nr:hypothetical protein [Sorangium sp.]